MQLVGSWFPNLGYSNEYRELYKKGLNDPDNHNGVVTHLEPDVLESEASGP